MPRTLPLIFYCLGLAHIPNTYSIETSKSTSSIWKHLSAINKGTTSNANNLPDEIFIDNVLVSDSNEIASKLNEYFSSIARILDNASTSSTEPDLTKLKTL